jgi:glucose/mannose-6-phosphate isomerase
MENGLKMKKIIRELPEQIDRAYRNAVSQGIQVEHDDYGAVYVGGMGGSAIAGDILRDYVGDHLVVPYQVVRDYRLHAPPPGKALFVINSYSGDTEEILSLLDQAEDLDADILAITTGGILKARSEAKGYPTIIIPPGYPPRSALGYSFVSLLYVLHPLYPEIDIETDMSSTVEGLQKVSSLFSSESSDNPSLALAREIQGKIPVIYTSNRLQSIALRWKGQFSENAKVIAFQSLLPEMNHNEICGWQNHPDALKKLHAIFLREDGEHERIRVRFEVTKELIEPLAGGLTELKTRGKSLLERLFYLIYMGDFVSFFLARLLDTDPMPVEKIDLLKKRMAQISRNKS